MKIDTIYIDNIVLNFQRIGGISVYITHLISALQNSFYNYMLLEQCNVGSNILRNKLNVEESHIVHENMLPLRLLSYLPIRLKLRAKSLVHSSYYRICSNVFAANVITVYDFNYEFGYVRHGIRKYLHCRQKKHAVEKADGVICISESTKQDLLYLYKNIDPCKIRVIHLAANTEFYNINVMNDIVHRFNNIIERKYVLFVGARTYHKNFNICVETLTKLAKYELVLVGSSLTTEEIKTLDTKLPSRYHAFSDASATDLNILYNYAFCFLYPTSYEGFGIPVLEAMQAGCPVVSTNISSIPEVSGTAGLLVDNICPEAFVEKIVSLEDASYRDKVINAGFEQAKKFSWDKTYQETVEFYHEVFNNKFGENDY